MSKNIFGNIIKQRKIEKDNVLNLGVIAATVLKDSIIIIPDTSISQIKSTLTVNRKTKVFKFFDTLKKKYENKIYYFSLFLGFIEHEETQLVFAEKVQVKQFGNYNIYKIVSVIVMDLKKFKRNKGLSILLTEYYGNNFYYSFDIDLTHSLNYSKIQDQQLKNQYRLNWMFFANRNQIIHCLKIKAPSYEEWVIPVIKGYYLNQKIDIEDKQVNIIFFWKVSILDLYKNLSEDKTIKLQLGSPSSIQCFDIIIYDVGGLVQKTIYYSNLKNITIDFNQKQTSDQLDYKMRKLDLERFFQMFRGLFDVQFLLVQKYNFHQKINEDNKLFDQNFKYHELAENIDNQYLEKFFKKVIFEKDSTFINEIYGLCYQTDDVFENFKIISKFFTNKMLQVSDPKYIGKIQNIIEFYFKNLQRQQENFEDNFPNRKLFTIIQDNGIKNLNKQKLDKIIYGSDQSFTKSLKKIHNKFYYPIYQYERIKCSIIIHNCGGKHPKNKKQNLNELIQIKYLDKQTVKESDLVIIGFQEIVEMKGKNLTNIVTNFNQHSVDSWVEYFNQRDDYILVNQVSLLGLMIVTLLKKDSKHKFSLSVTEHQSVKQGFMNIAANKGGINLQMNINLDQISLFNVHLAAGNGNVNNEQRIQGLREFMDIQSKKIESDAVFYFGDMNFRNNSEQKEIVSMINKYFKENQPFLKKQILSDMLQKDDLISYKKKLSSKDIFNNLKEQEINFLPSYKLILDEGKYDLDIQKKKPSWTDRVLYQNFNLKNFNVLYYNTDKKTLFSDHQQVKKSCYMYV